MAKKKSLMDKAADAIDSIVHPHASEEEVSEILEDSEASSDEIEGNKPSRSSSQSTQELNHRKFDKFKKGTEQ